ncbi:MAG: hypothetical protein VB980_04475 [Opitutales bacterium]
MVEDLDLADDVPFAPQDFVLRIPGEHFFCECIQLPESLEEKDIESYLEEEMQRLSPFPSIHLQWGYRASLPDRKALIFGALHSKLRQLGWENLEIFRRVFPSFISLLSNESANRYERPTISLLRHEGSLTAASFDPGCPIPRHIYSLALTEEEMEDGTVEITRGKLLALFELHDYEIDSRIMRTGEVNKDKDSFCFIHLDEDFEETEELLRIDADELWDSDVRGLEFKQEEQKERKFSRVRWSALLAAAAFVCLFSLLEIGLVLLSDKVELVAGRNRLGQEKVAEVRNLESVLFKLEQNDRGGIDPMRAFSIVAAEFPMKTDPQAPQNQMRAVHLTDARLPNRNELEIKGVGDNLEHVNLFITNLEAADQVEVTDTDKSQKKANWQFILKLKLKEDQGQPLAKLDSNPVK